MQRADQISGTTVQMIKDYKEFLNIPKEHEKMLFRGVLTHCDFDTEAENPADDDELLDIIEELIPSIKDND